MKTAIAFAACLLAGSAFAAPKDNAIGKQVRLQHQKMGVIVGRAENGFIVMPAGRAQAFSRPNRRAAAE
jgi:hypothetical protein